MSEPPIVSRPALALWLFERDLTLREGAAIFETTAETLRRAVLPLEDPGMRVPYPGLMRRIIERTHGAIRADDWYPQRAEAAA